MKKKDVAKKMSVKHHASGASHCEECNKLAIKEKHPLARTKGKGSLNFTAKHKVDFEGQQSYKEENT